MKLRIGAMALGISVMLAAFTGCGAQNEETKQAVEAKNVKVVTAKKSGIAIENEFAGEIKAGNETNVVPKVPGKVKAVSVKVGDSVKEGDLLFELDSDDVKAQLAQAEAGAEVARTNRDKASGSGYSQSLLQVQNEYDQARQSFDDENSNYNRTKTLFESGGVSQRDMDSAQLRYNLARQRYDTAKQNLDLFRNASGPQNVNIAQSQYQQALANVEMVKAQLNNMSVKAPIAGVVTVKNINPGEGVSSAQPAVVISDTGELTAELSIPERLITKFSMGQKLTVAVQSIGDKSFNGEVSLVHPAADPVSKSYKVKVKLLDKAEEIKPGMFAKIKIAVEQKENVITVPNQAIFSESGIQYVYVVRDSKVVKTPIKVGLSNDRHAEVTEGLSVDDSLIIEGQSFLSDGDTVNVMTRS